MNPVGVMLRTKFQPDGQTDGQTDKTTYYIPSEIFFGGDNENFLIKRDLSMQGWVHSPPVAVSQFAVLPLPPGVHLPFRRQGEAVLAPRVHRNLLDEHMLYGLK